MIKKDLIHLKAHIDARGSLVVLEKGNNLPFELKRVYYIFGSDDSTERGFHAHKELQQIAVALSGSCVMVLDDGEQKVEFQLNNPTKAVFIDKMIWREMKDFSSDCVLLVAASMKYDENDYIRDYDEFLKGVKNGDN